CFSSSRRHTRFSRDWSSDVCSSDLIPGVVDGALIVYHQPGHDDWRFSFYSKSKYWDDEGNEIKKETHPKRYTYVLGKGETCVTRSEERRVGREGSQR